MKKVLLLLVVVVVAWLAVNYMKTGEVALFPGAANAGEQHLRDLQRELEGVNAQINQAGRAAGATGLDTTNDVQALMVKKEKLEKEIAEVRQKMR
jgi:seryl-tRNA synthetase